MAEEEVFEDEETRKAMGYGFPEQEEKHNLIAFFRHILEQDFNAKTANLTEEELGFAKIPVRTNMEIANYCRMMGMGGFAEAFMDDAQITLSTSLSRGGFLPKLAVTTQKFSETSLKKQLGQQDRGKKGLFGKKKEEAHY